ncbi:MAG: DUF3798 domain-containing protein [Deltaproteobacteria bacterium]|jgi:hypothetical protein|nr:DUF3798 domain-containing protein [Deltaproteobacteria bacterium]
MTENKTDEKKKFPVPPALALVVAAAVLAGVFLLSGSGEKSSSESVPRAGAPAPSGPGSATAGSVPDAAKPAGAGPESGGAAGRAAGSGPGDTGSAPADGGDPFDFNIGLMTSSDHQGADVLGAVRELVAKYGDAGSGGKIRHVTHPDNFLANLDETMARIEGLADDPKVRVIVVAEGIPGTAEAFRNIRKKRPEIFLLVSESHEDADLISSVADMVVNADFVSRGFLIPYAANHLGAKTFVHVSFPRHMIDESLSRQRAIMEMASRDLGLKFVHENAPDPTGEAGVEGAKEYIRRNVPLWLEKYGPDTAFFTTNNAHTAPMIEQVVKYGGYFVEADEASPLMGYPEALGLDLADTDGDWSETIKIIEKEIAARGAEGRLGTWTSSVGRSHSLALTEFGILLARGLTTPTNTEKLLSIYDSLTPGVKWNGNFLVDTNLNLLENVFLIYQDTYIFGRGYLGTGSMRILPKYLTARIDSGQQPPPSDFHMAIVTGGVSQGAEDVVGAWEMIKRYGSVESGGLIRHVVYPDEYLDDEKAAADLIASLADDPLLKVVVVNQAIPGTAEGFRRVKEARPDVICLAGEPHESAEIITQTADLVVAGDFISRGYLLPYSARELGADTFVHISFKRHLGYESMRQRLNIMRQACLDLGLDFAQEEAPDPAGEAGPDGAQRHITETYPGWLAKYGPETAFFATNDAHTEPLIRQLIAHGGYFIEADIPSPLLGYPAALNLDLQPHLGQWETILKIVEKAVVDSGGSGRLGTWAYPLGFTQTAGLLEFGKLLAEDQTSLSDIQVLLQCLGIFSPGARWNGSFLNDPVSGKPLRNYLLVYQDTYVFGLGYLGTTQVEIPDKYYAITPD